MHHLAVVAASPLSRSVAVLCFKGVKKLDLALLSPCSFGFGVFLVFFVPAFIAEKGLDLSFC